MFVESFGRLSPPALADMEQIKKHTINRLRIFIKIQ